MGKTLLQALLIVALSLGSVSAARADGESRLIYSCDTGKGVTGNYGNVGTPLKQNYDVAVKVPGDKFAGYTIEAVRVPMEQMTNLSGLKVWLTKALTLKTIDGKKTNVPDITSIDADMAQGWVEVTLSEPYTITEDGVYVGYSFTMDEMDDTNQRPVRITTETHEGGLWMHSSRSYRSWVDLSENCSSTLQVLMGNAPLYGAAVSTEGAYFGTTGKRNEVTFILDNRGATGIQSVDYTYEYNGGTYTGHSNLENAVSSVYDASAYFSFKLPAVQEKGYYPLNLKVTKVNGGDNSETAELTQTVSIFDVVPKHRSVLEEYTSTNCGYCPRGYVGLQVMNRLYPEDFIAVSYHCYYNADDPMEMNGLRQSDGSFNFPNSISGFPAAYLDRQYSVDAYYGFDTSLTNIGVDQVWKATCNLLAEADIEVEGKISADQKYVDATATVKYPLTIDNANYRVEFILLADSLTGSGDTWQQLNYYYNGSEGTFAEPEFAVFTSGEYHMKGLKYNDIAVASTRTSGYDVYLPATVEADKAYELNTAFRLASVVNVDGESLVQNMDNLRLVALLINNRTGNVVNAAKGRVVNPSTGIRAVSEVGDANLSEQLYSPSGMRLAAMQKGLNIVRTASGKTVKVMKK